MMSLRNKLFVSVLFAAGIILSYVQPAEAILISNTQGKSTADDKIEQAISKQTTLAISQVYIAITQIEMEGDFSNATEAFTSARATLQDVAGLIGEAINDASNTVLGVDTDEFKLPEVAQKDALVESNVTALRNAMNFALRRNGKETTDRGLYEQLAQETVAVIAALELAIAASEVEDAASVRIALLRFEAYVYFTIGFSAVWDQADS